MDNTGEKHLQGSKIVSNSWVLFKLRFQKRVDTARSQKARSRDVESNSSLLCFYLFCCKHFDWFTVFKLPTMHFSEKSLLKIVIIINIRAVAKIRSASSAKIQENVKNMKNFRSTSPLHYFQPWIKHRRKRGWKNLTARSERKFSAPSFCVSNPISNPISHISYGSRAADQSLNTTFWQKTPILSP